MPALRSRILLITLVLGALLSALTGREARAADPQRYSVHFVSTGNGPLNSLLKASSQLQSLRKSAPVSPFALVDRAQQDVGRLQSALQSYGYYESKALITIQGHTLNDPALPRLLAAMPKKSSARVVVNFQLGPRYHLGRISVQGPVSPEAVAALKLKSGDPAISQDVLDAGQRLQNALQEQGHAYARVEEPPVAILQEHTRTLDITFKADPGPVYRLGSIRFEGLKLVKEPFLRSQLTIHEGDPYRSTRIEQTRQALLNLGVFAAVSVRLPPRAQVQGGEVPLTFVVTERKRHGVTLDGLYSSDLGIIAATTWTDRNVFGRADQLALGANVFGLGGNGTATNGVSYDLSAQLTLPDFVTPTQSLQFGLQALKPELTAYSQTAVIGGATLARRLSSVWNVSGGVAMEQEKIHQSEVPNCPAVQGCNYTLLSLPLTIRYDSTDLANPLLDPVHGLRVQILLTPTETLFGHRATFAIVQVNASTYFDLSHLGWTSPGASVLALRALAGQAFGVGQFYNLPPDLRFYAGGSATVRGYAYQALGPTFPPPDAPGQYPEGGTGITAGSIEFRQRVWGNLGMAVFFDGGAVTAPCTAPAPCPARAPGTIGSGQYGFGYGGGPRYYTPIGPIRLDVAFPVNRSPGMDAFEVYIGLGQAF